MGVMFGEAIFHAILIFMVERKMLHITYVLVFVSMSLVLGYNDEYGLIAASTPSYDYNSVWHMFVLYVAPNMYIVGTTFLFALMPRFRKVNNTILIGLSATALAVGILLSITSEAVRNILLAVNTGVLFSYYAYVLIQLIRVKDNRIKGSTLILSFFAVFVAFIVYVAYLAFIQSPDLWKIFMIGCVFPVMLSFVMIFRRFQSYLHATTNTNPVNFSSDLTKRMEELEYANDSKNKFFSIIAHDLKSPIGSIKTLSDIYVEEATTSRDPHAIDLALALRDSIDSLCDLLEDLLSWSRSQLGAMQYMPSYIQIDDLVEDTKRLLKPLYTAKGIGIKVTVNDRDKLYGDSNMLHTILRNLLTNAIKFSYCDSCVMVDFSAEGVYSVIKVTDNGIGMSREVLSNLFQIDKIPTRVGTNKESSNGLGLIVCHEFVEKHGGTIEVEAEEGLGTTIIVKLPFMRYMDIMKASHKKAGNDITSSPAQKNEK